MAVAFRSSAQTSNGSDSKTCNKPTGAAVGDVLVAYVVTFDSFTVTTTPPTGWTEIAHTDFRDASGNNGGTVWAFWKLVNGSEGSSFTWSPSPANFTDIAIACYSGVDGTTPVQAGSTTNKGSSSTATALGITAGRDGSMLVTAFIGFTRNTSTTFALPSGMTSRIDGWDQQHDLDDKAVNSGATGDMACTTTSVAWAAIASILQPAAANAPVLLTDSTSIPKRPQTFNNPAFQAAPPLLPLTPTAGVQFYPSDGLPVLKRPSVVDVSALPLASISTTVPMSSWHHDLPSTPKPVGKARDPDNSNPLLPYVSVRDHSWSRTGVDWQYRTKPNADGVANGSGLPTLPKNLTDLSWAEPPAVKMPPRPRAEDPSTQDWIAGRAQADLSWARPTDHLVRRFPIFEAPAYAFLPSPHPQLASWLAQDPHVVTGKPRPQGIDAGAILPIALTLVSGWLTNPDDRQVRRAISGALDGLPIMPLVQGLTASWLPSVTDRRAPTRIGGAIDADPLMPLGMPLTASWLPSMADRRAPSRIGGAIDGDAIPPILGALSGSWRPTPDDMIPRRRAIADHAAALVQPLTGAQFTDLSWAFQPPTSVRKRVYFGHETFMRPVVAVALSSWGWIPEVPLRPVLRKPLSEPFAALMTPVTTVLPAIAWYPSMPERAVLRAAVQFQEVAFARSFAMLADGWRADTVNPPTRKASAQAGDSLPLGALAGSRLDWSAESPQPRRAKTAAEGGESLVQPTGRFVALEWSHGQPVVVAKRMTIAGETVEPRGPGAGAAMTWSAMPADVVARRRVIHPDDVLALRIATVGVTIWEPVSPVVVRSSRRVFLDLERPIPFLVAPVLSPVAWIPQDPRVVIQSTLDPQFMVTLEELGILPSSLKRILARLGVGPTRLVIRSRGSTRLRMK